MEEDERIAETEHQETIGKDSTGRGKEAIDAKTIEGVGYSIQKGARKQMCFLAPKSGSGSSKGH